MFDVVWWGRDPEPAYEAGENTLGVPEVTWSEEAVQETEVDYRDFPDSAFVVSGPLKPFNKREVRCLTNRAFGSVAEAMTWAKATYPKVYRDESKPGMGLWAFRVAPVQKESSK